MNGDFKINSLEHKEKQINTDVLNNLKNNNEDCVQYKQKFWQQNTWITQKQLIIHTSHIKCFFKVL